MTVQIKHAVILQKDHGVSVLKDKKISFCWLSAEREYSITSVALEKGTFLPKPNLLGRVDRLL